MQINFHIYQGCQLFVPRVYDYMSHTKYVIQRKQDILGNIVHTALLSDSNLNST